MNTTDTNSKPFSVGLWDAHPDSGEDACYTGEDFATLDEAQACASDVREFFGWIRASRRIPYVLVSGPGVREVRTIDGPEPDDVAQEREDREARAWRRELATEAGMYVACDDSSIVCEDCYSLDRGEDAVARTESAFAEMMNGDDR